MEAAGIEPAQDFSRSLSLFGSASDSGRTRGAVVPAEAVDGRAAGRVDGRPVDDCRVRGARAEVIRGAVPAEAAGGDRDRGCGDQYKDEARSRTDHVYHQGAGLAGPHRWVDSWGSVYQLQGLPA